jgi:hypothetical protein
MEARAAALAGSNAGGIYVGFKRESESTIGMHGWNSLWICDIWRNYDYVMPMS